MSAWPEAVLVVAGAGLAAFFAGSETGAYVLNRLRLRYRAGSGVRRAAVLERLLDDLPGFVTALLIWTNLSVYLVSAACTALFYRMGTAIGPELAATLAAAPVLFAFSELAPKDLYRRRSDALMLSGARALFLAVWLVRPLAKAFAALGNAVRRILGLGREQNWALVSRRALRQQFAEGEAQGAFSGPQRSLVENILQSAARPATAAALGLSELPVLPADATARDLLARAADLPYSRVPLCEGGPGDEARHDVVGVVHVLEAWAADPEAKLRDLASPPVWLDAGASVIQALGSLRRARASMGFLKPETDSPVGQGAGPGDVAVVTVAGLLRRVTSGAR